MRSRRRAIAAAALVTALAVTACADGSRRERASTPTTAAPAATTTTAASPAAGAALAPATCSRPHAPGQSSESFDFEGTTRTYELYVPAGYDGTQPFPLVFNFHGFGSNAKEQMVYGDFRPLAEQHGFVIVAPDGQGANQHYNLTGEPGLQDDVALAGGLLDHLEAALCVDPARVYSTGMSDGGAMTSVLACRASDRFAAFAPVAVIIQPFACDGRRPVAVAGFMGTDDAIVPFDGGPVNCCGNFTLGSAPDALQAWADHDGCDPAFTEEQLDTEIRRRTWSNCEAGAEVIFYIVDGGGHSWPGAIAVPGLGHTTTQLDASATIWAFFVAHPLPA